ncbi:hypothetical protein FA15DRAFT_672402 [Coprinopsis marcescibilis]|uniref:MARVEL domain-containing protein n=1 Tax=Coprinopsis marcescibilis TaxID=230819 RepID=A0A5C3KMW9_COPMA|nr:hypothetical protein FA15DRAFT_672402 [Coprinopsis marcescibilis]
MGAGSDSAVRRAHPILFGSIVLFALIEMCIAAWLTAKYNANHNYPFGSVRTRVRYILFCSIWTVFVGTIFLVLFMVTSAGSIFTSVAAHFIFLLITFILWIAAAASITESLGGGLSCSHQNFFAYCGQLNAVEGFAWLVWILVTAALIMVLIRGIAAAKSGDGVSSGLVSSEA